MTTYIEYVGTSVMYLGGTAVVLGLILLVLWLFMVTFAWMLKSWIETHEGWDSFHRFRVWYNSEAGRETRAVRDAAFKKYTRFEKWFR